MITLNDYLYSGDTVPQSRPLPPASEVPPITTAAIASVSYPEPVDVTPDVTRADVITPARADKTPEIIYTEQITFLVLIPDTPAWENPHIPDCGMIFCRSHT